MIMKLLLIAAVIAVVYFMFIKKKPLKSSESKTKKEPKVQANDMVECAQCSLYIEVSESIISHGKYYCSQECVTQAEER